MCTSVEICHAVFECAICLEDMVLRQPRALSCLHSFCHQCLQGLVSKNTITCPVCRKPTILDVKGVQDLPKNIYLRSYQDAIHSSHKSRFCEECYTNGKSNISAGYRCNECDISFCQTCSAEHVKLAIFTSHRLLPMAANSNNMNLCSSHRKNTILFCKQCAKAICVLCVKAHIEHQDNITKFEIGIAEMVSFTTGQLENARKVNNVRRERAEKLSSVTEEVKTKLKEHVDKLKGELEQSHQELVEELDVEYIIPCQQLQQQAQEQDKCLAAILNEIYMMKLPTNMTDVNTLGDIQRRITKLSGQSISLPAPQFEPTDCKIVIGKLYQIVENKTISLDKERKDSDHVNDASGKLDPNSVNNTIHNASDVENVTAHCSKVTFGIFVKNVSNSSSKTMTLMVSSSETIEAVKQKIQNRIRIHYNRLRLQFAGKILCNENTVELYSINRDNTLYLFITH